MEDWRDLTDEESEAMAEDADEPVPVMVAVREESSEEREAWTEDWALERELARELKSEDRAPPREVAIAPGALVKVLIAPAMSEVMEGRTPCP